MSDSQVPFATLGNAIGFISKLSGSVTIQSIDGQERVVKIGDPIFFGETVVTGANSSVTIAFIDGTEVVIGGDSVVEITDEIYNSGDNQDLVADSSTDIDALQNAILAGDDPTLVQDAPAAGETQGEQQRVDVDVQRTGALGGISGGNDTDYSSSLPGFGYDTNGQGSYGSRQENVTTTQQNTTRNSSSDTTTSDTSVSTPTISLATSSDTGESNSDLLTNDTTATFTLSNIDSDVVLVQIYNGDTLINSTTAVDGLQTFTAEVGDLTEGTNSLTIKVTDSSGNTSTSSPVVVTLDTVANEGTVTVNAITSDDVINANEAAGTVTVTGTATGGDIAEGDAVTMTINGNVYNTTVDASGNWSVDVAGSDLAADTEFDVVVTSSDDAGNTVNSVGTSTHTVDVDINGRMSISDVTSDDIISAAEAQGTVAITGIVSGDVKNGDIVTLTVNGKEYSGSVTNRLFSIDVAGSDLAQDSDRRIDATITLSDNAGNILVVTANSNYQVDTTAASAPTVSIVDDTNDDGLISKDELGNNNVQVSVAVNAADLAAGGSVTLSIGNGDSDNTVTLTAGDLTDNATYSYDAETGTITWTESVAEGAQITVTATQTDAAGNESGTGSDSATLDTTAASAPGVTITEDVNDNGYISAAELDGDVNVTISLTGTNAVEGDKLTVNGETITLTAAQIEAGEVLTTVAAPAEGATLTVETTITDKAGNVSEKGSDSAIMDTSVSGLTSDITDATNSGSNDDTITNDATPDISGVTEAGATV
ncbi:retention module-containing protein, partial [Marinomonas sp.]